jgi:hypothetical protein
MSDRLYTTQYLVWAFYISICQLTNKKQNLARIITSFHGSVAVMMNVKVSSFSGGTDVILLNT